MLAGGAVRLARVQPPGAPADRSSPGSTDATSQSPSVVSLLQGADVPPQRVLEGIGGRERGKAGWRWRREQAQRRHERGPARSDGVPAAIATSGGTTITPARAIDRRSTHKPA